MPAPWQLCFDDGHQQRYLPDRQAVLRYVLALGPKAASKRFEVFAESGPVLLADGTPGGRTFSLVEVIDLGRPGETERLQAELAALTIKELAGSESRESARQGLPSQPEPHALDMGGGPFQRRTP
jgi:hypothetical protein